MIIKFRGWSIQNKQWATGDLVQTHPNNLRMFILPQGEFWNHVNCPSIRNFIEVIPESVGQFTGLLDKKKKEIYEGDIIKVPALMLPPDEGGFVKKEDLQIVKWSISMDGVYEETLYSGFSLTIGDVGDDRNSNIYEVIGNFFENPELLGTK